MKILYFASVDFFEKPNPSFHLMLSMLTDILEHGDEVYYVGVSNNSVVKHIPAELKNNPKFQYSLVETKNVNKSAFIKRYLKGILYAIKANKYVKNYVGQCDLIFVQSSPTVLYNLFIAKRHAKNRKIIYNVQDMFPGSSIASGVMPQKILQRIFYFLQKSAYKLADKIIAISNDMRTKLIEQGVPKEKISVVVNWFDDKSVHEVPWAENRFVQKYQLEKNKFYVQYAGTMGYVFDYKVVIEAAEKLKEFNNIVFQMIGEGSQKDSFSEEVRKRNLQNIHFLPLQEQKMVSDVYSACSVCLIPLKRGVIGNSVPSKAGLLMACKRPVINSVDKESEYYQMFFDNEIGLSVDAGDSNGVVEAILRMYSDENYRKKCSLNGFEYGKLTYSRSYNMNRYFDIFREMVDGSK